MEGNDGREEFRESYASVPTSDLIPALVIGGSKSLDRNLLDKIREHHGITVKWHWERLSNAFTFPPSAQVVIALRNHLSHSLLWKVDTQADKLGIPFVTVSKSYSKAVDELTRAGFPVRRKDTVVATEKRNFRNYVVDAVANVPENVLIQADPVVNRIGKIADKNISTSIIGSHLLSLGFRRVKRGNLIVGYAKQLPLHTDENGKVLTIGVDDGTFMLSRSTGGRPLLVSDKLEFEGDPLPAQNDIPILHPSQDNAKSPDITSDPVTRTAKVVQVKPQQLTQFSETMNIIGLLSAALQSAAALGFGELSVTVDANGKFIISGLSP